MTISLLHSFVSTKTQGSDPTKSSKNEWNAEHSLQMATGKLLGRTTASTGAVEEITPNSTDFTLSSQALALAQPAIIRILTDDVAGNNDNAVQAIFSTNGSFDAEATTTYEFDALYYITRGAGTTSHTTSILFGGTATFTSVRYLAQVTNPTGNALDSVQQIMGTSAGAVVLTAANTSATENLMILLRGHFRVNGVGTIIPQFQYSVAPGGTPILKRNTFFRMRKLGTNAMTSVGSWT